jgi:Raf kinase inhibitor-like YbhB/YbcL family protein
MMLWPLLMSLVVQSPGFAGGERIPKQFTCDGADQSPRLQVSDLPPATQSWAVIVDDPDAPSGTFVHWVVWNLPPQQRSVGAAVPRDAIELPDGARQGRNDFGKVGWGGPCPPPGKPHHYRFRVLALGTKLALPPRATAADVEREAKGHVLAEGTLTGQYGR